MNKLEQQLSELQYTFSNTFEFEIMQKISSKAPEMWPNFSLMVSGVAASILLCLGLIYLQDGSISFESILGVKQMNNYNFADILTYYQS